MPPPEKKRIPRETPPKQAKTWTQAVSQHLNKLNASGLFYPQEAIARGLEGEVLVLIIIDESGRVTAARVEEGSGHTILDDAALTRCSFAALAARRCTARGAPAGPLPPALTTCQRIERMA